MDLCSGVRKDNHETIKKMNEVIMSERLRSAEFKTTTNIIQDLDTNNPIAFPLLYEFKREDIDAQIHMSKEVQEYYKSGKNDPSRVAAIEKLKKK